MSGLFFNNWFSTTIKISPRAMKHFNLACFEVSKFQNDIVHVGGKEKDHWTTRAKVRLLNRCLDPSLNELHERPVM